MGQTWSKDLFFHNSHLGSDIREDSGLDEEPFGTVTLTAEIARSTFFLSYVNVIHDPLSKHTGNHQIKRTVNPIQIPTLN